MQSRRQELENTEHGRTSNRCSWFEYAQQDNPIMIMRHWNKEGATDSQGQHSGYGGPTFSNENKELSMDGRPSCRQYCVRVTLLVL